MPLSCCEAPVEDDFRGMGTVKRWVTSVICCDSKQNAATPSPQTTAPTSAPRPGMVDSSTRPKAILSQPSCFSIRTSRKASMSRVWKAPSFTCAFSEVTGPIMWRTALGELSSWSPPLLPSWLAGVPAGAKTTFLTWRVRLSRTLCDSVDPVADVLVTRLYVRHIYMNSLDHIW